MRYFIYLAYDGTNYHGWQIQPNGASVQEMLMKALSTFLRKDIEVVGAGRTDAGVHAKLMIAHFDFDAELDGKTVTDKLNRLLPHDIAVYDVKRLGQRNVNASKNSAHVYGTTFDITYKRFFKVEDPDGRPMQDVRADTLKLVLSEVLRDLKKKDMCYVKYELKQACFHITAR